MNNEEYSETLKVLTQRKLPVWHPIMKGGKPLFDRLLTEFEASPNRLSARQMVNVMLVLVRLRQWGDIRKLCEALGQHVESPSIEVRSEAAKYLAGFLRLSHDPSHKNEKFERQLIYPFLERARSQGLRKQVAELVDDVLR
jgi:hypothetical protein